MTNRWRNILLVVDGLALVGAIAFSVLAALNPETTGYIIAQIVCAALILGSVALLRRARNNH
jgi:hypothetical protein